MNPERRIKSIALLFVMLSSLNMARADLMLERTTNGNWGMTQTTNVKGHKLRSDIEMLFRGTNHVSLCIIVDSDSGQRAVAWNHSNNFQLICMPSNLPKWEDFKARIIHNHQDSGHSEKVGNYDAEIYTQTHTNCTIAYWVVKNFPKYANYKASLDQMNSLLVGLEGYEEFDSSFEDLPGMVVKQTLTVDGKTTTTELASISDSPVDDSLFEIPKPAYVIDAK